MAYNRGNNYNNVPFYGNPNYDNGYAYQHRSSTTGNNYPQPMLNMPPAYNGLEQNYMNAPPPLPVYANMNACQRRNSCRTLQNYNVGNVPENNYAVNRRNRNLSYQTENRKYNEYSSSESNISSSSDDSANAENVIRISNRQGNNNLQIYYKEDEHRGNGRNEKRVRNKSIIQVNYDEGEDKYNNDNYRRENINKIDICDSGRNGGNTCITINVNDNIDNEQENSEDVDENENETNVSNNKNKNTKPRKLFMGKYFPSDVKKKYSRPSHLGAAHPNFLLPNPNIACYGISQKRREKEKKPELIVRY